MSFWVAVIAALFMWVVGYWVLGNFITGTSAGEVLLQTVSPLALAVAILATVVKPF